MFADQRMSKPGDDVGNGRLRCIAELIASIQVHLGAYDQVNAVETSACAAKTYLDVLTGTGLEGWEGLNILDEVFVAFAQTVCVPWILHQEIADVGLGSGSFRVAMLLTPGWGRNLRVIANAWQVELPVVQA